MARSQALQPPVLPGYSYVRALGQGGFADVFLYQQDMPRRQVAVKVLHAQVDAAAARALAAEADALAALSAHPSILTLHEASVSADGRPYMVVEHCPGSLRGYRAEPMEVERALAIGVRIASAVEAAHRAGLLHRDIKPSNILITAFGQPVLADFGVATVRAAGDADEIAMSPPWSAPEVVDHRSTGTVASEVWSLAATVYSLLAQRSPFEVPERRLPEPQLKARIRQARYTPTGRDDVPQSLEDALAGGLRRIPGDRYPTALAFAQALQDVQRRLDLPVTPLDVPDESWARTVAAPDPDTPRGPVRSTVPVASRRARGTSSEPAGEAPRRRRGIGVLVGLVAGVAAAAAGVAAAVLLGG
ncbi:serine/threonine-protein kinase [Demequina pelophila]|uniref:serine/threonine-protein kinase n=1 Tax=Demequina pelophila TaxID=1638984 RepID=UPI0007810645|nr:serine/threonine-protein kinase [Demequina pelophila]